MLFAWSENKSHVYVIFKYTHADMLKPMSWRLNLKVKCVNSVPFNLFFYFSQEQEENKGATSWPEYYIDQLNSMAAVSMSFLKTFSFSFNIHELFMDMVISFS